MNGNDIITQITSIRAKNNVCWMGLLRLALKSDPAKAQKILMKITKNDRLITKLTSKLK